MSRSKTSQAVLLDVQLLPVMLQNDGHIVRIMLRLEAKRQSRRRRGWNVILTGRCSERAGAHRRSWSVLRPAAARERRRGRDEDRERRKHRRTGIVHRRPCGVSSTPRTIVSITTVSGILDRLPGADKWQLVCVRVAARSFTQCHNRFSKEEAQGMTGRQHRARVHRRHTLVTRR